MNRDLVLYWNEKASTMLNLHTNPGSDARRMAIVHIGIHDALNSIKKKYDRYAYSGSFKPNASPQAAVCAAARKMLEWAILDIEAYKVKMFSEGGKVPFTFDGPGKYLEVQQWYHEKMDEIPNNPKKMAGIILGEQASFAIIQARNTDGHGLITIFSESPSDGTLPGEFKADYYQMLPELGQKKKLMTDYGTKVDPFVLDLDSQATLRPASLAASPQDLNEVLVKGTSNYVTNSLSTAEKAKVDVWRNLNQHIVWNDFTVEIVKNRNASFNAWDTARLLALIHTAMADGTLLMFRDIYKNYRWRPVTAIKSNSNSGWVS